MDSHGGTSAWSHVHSRHLTVIRFDHSWLPPLGGGQDVRGGRGVVALVRLAVNLLRRLLDPLLDHDPRADSAESKGGNKVRSWIAPPASARTSFSPYFMSTVCVLMLLRGSRWATPVLMALSRSALRTSAWEKQTEWKNNKTNKNKLSIWLVEVERKEVQILWYFTWVVFFRYLYTFVHKQSLLLAICLLILSFNDPAGNSVQSNTLIMQSSIII